MRVLTLNSDGSSTSIDSNTSGAVLQDLNATWHVHGHRLVIGEHRDGIGSFLDVIPGVAPIEETEVDIVSVSENELILGDPADPIIYRRKGTGMSAVSP